MGMLRYRDIEIDGVVYPDAAAAAAARGVTPETVRIAVRRGTQHRVGAGVTGFEPMPVRVRGAVFDDAAAVAAHFGVTKGAVYSALSRGRIDRLGLRGPRPGKSFAVCGLRFVSLRAADAALGFRPGYISLALRRKSRPSQERILSAAMIYAARAPVTQKGASAQ